MVEWEVPNESSVKSYRIMKSILFGGVTSPLSGRPCNLNDSFHDRSFKLLLEVLLSKAFLRDFSRPLEGFQRIVFDVFKVFGFLKTTPIGHFGWDPMSSKTLSEPFNSLTRPIKGHIRP